MDFFSFFIIICSINSVFYFFDVIFKSCSHYPYIRFLQKSGLNIGFFKIIWFTTSFNRTLILFSSFKSKFLLKWYSLGAIITVCLVPISLLLLIINILNIVKEDKTVNEYKPFILEPMVPGLNLPISDIGYYFVTVAISSIIHEIGHAVAAIKEGIQISGVGMIIFFMIPIAFVKMNSEQVATLHPKRQLRIFCAGIWHNIVLSLLAYLFLLALPILLSPFYDLGRGVYVLNVKEHSKIAGVNGIFAGDKLVAVNDCEISDQESWQQCLMSFNNKPSPGYCVSEDTIHEFDESIPIKITEEGIIECCDKSKDANLCFQTLEGETPLEILQYSCLPGRPIVAGTAYMCRTPKDCPPGLHCIRPIVPQGASLLRIQRTLGNVVIFIGKPKHVLATVEVSDYLQIFTMFHPRLPEILLHLAKYLVLFSSGLAIVNAVPCFYFDGYHITNSIINYFMEDKFRYKYLFALFCNFLGLLLLLASILGLMWKIVSANL